MRGLVEGRILRESPGARVVRPAWQRDGQSAGRRGRVVGSAVLAAEQRAAQRVADAEARAQALLRRAESEASELRARVETEARAAAAAEVAERSLALALRESQGDARQLDRVVVLARLLAERLLGEALALEPGRVVALAREVVAEARGARRIQVVAHPEDARLLAEELHQLGLPVECLQVTGDARRQRGSLRLVTDVGELDAELGPQLARLAERLRESLEAEPSLLQAPPAASDRGQGVEK